MKRLILVVLLCAAGIDLQAQGRDSVLVVFWNVENFFDWTDSGAGESDSEYSSYGKKHWTRSRFYSKCDAISKSIMWIGDRYGRMPDVIGLAEVENRGVLTKLLNYSLLRKYDYSIVHRESGDRRGIDVALLYRRSSVTLVSKSFKTPSCNGSPMSTRDILHASMMLNDGRKMEFIVNHHPSKYGGSAESEDRRNAAMCSLKELCDSIYIMNGNQIIAMGDFNDTPDGSQFSLISDLLENKGTWLHENGEGTIRYKGKWELIDSFLVSDSVITSDMDIVKIPFLMTYDKRYPGEKPFRTYTGPRYTGGISDHCPISIIVY